MRAAVFVCQHKGDLRRQRPAREMIGDVSLIETVVREIQLDVDRMRLSALIANDIDIVFGHTNESTRSTGN